LPALRVEFEGAETKCMLLADGHDTPPRKSKKYTPECSGESVIVAPWL
jgi:hypothetical protein